MGNTQLTLELGLIETNPFQPRTSFNEEELAGLASSIEELGVVQPITVRKLDGENKYNLYRGNAASGHLSWQDCKLYLPIYV